MGRGPESRGGTRHTVRCCLGRDPMEDAGPSVDPLLVIFGFTKWGAGVIDFFTTIQGMHGAARVRLTTEEKERGCR